MTPMKVLKFQVGGLTGRDFWAELFLPRKLFLRWLQRRLRAEVWKGIDAATCALIFQYQGQYWRIMPDGSLEQPSNELLRSA